MKKVWKTTAIVLCFLFGAGLLLAPALLGEGGFSLSWFAGLSGKEWFYLAVLVLALVALVLLPSLIGRVGKGAPRSLDRTDRPGKQLFYGPNYEEPTNREIDRALKKLKGQKPDGAR